MFQLDLGALFEKAPVMWTYDNNVQTLDLECKGIYNSTLGNYLAAQSKTTVSALA